MAGVLIDTDILIDYLRDHEEAAGYLERLKDPRIISSVSVGELYSGVRDGKEAVNLEIFLNCFRIIPLDFAIAKSGGLFCRDFRKSHGVGLADAFIAATAEIHHLEFATLNQKHFPMLRGVIVPYKKN